MPWSRELLHVVGQGRPWIRWLIVVVGVTGTGALALKPLGWDWPWLVAALVVIAAVATPWAKVMTGQIETAIKRDDERRIALRSGLLDGGRRHMRDYSDPTDLGVHRALVPAGQETYNELPESVPLYVPRDQHEEMVKLLSSGTFVIVLGNSGAGKTRFAFEALMAALPGHRLIAPDRDTLKASIDEMAAVADAVLWLDDLEVYLGVNGLTAMMVRRASA